MPTRRAYFSVRLLGLPCNVKSQTQSFLSSPVHQLHKSDACHHIPLNNVFLQPGWRCRTDTAALCESRWLAVFSRFLEKVCHFLWFSMSTVIRHSLTLQKIVMAVHIKLGCCLFIWLSPLKWLPLHPGRDYCRLIGSCCLLPEMTQLKVMILGCTALLMFFFISFSSLLVCFLFFLS